MFLFEFFVLLLPAVYRWWHFSMAINIPYCLSSVCVILIFIQFFKQVLFSCCFLFWVFLLFFYSVISWVSSGWRSSRRRKWKSGRFRRWRSNKRWKRSRGCGQCRTLSGSGLWQSSPLWSRHRSEQKYGSSRCSHNASLSNLAPSNNSH